MSWNRFLQNNCLTVIENMSTFVHLDTLNVSNNFIRALGSELRHLPALRTLQISSNQLSTVEDLEELRFCKVLRWSLE
jgi:Leucine-rich repeat (LRR) protein